MLKYAEIKKILLDNPLMTYAHIARETGFNYSTIRYALTNDRNPDREVIEKISDWIESNPPLKSHTVAENNRKKSISVHDIVEKYLIENGFDGLCSDHCGCKLGDLFKCSSMQIYQYVTKCIVYNCVAGRVKDCQTCDAWEGRCTEDNNFCIERR